MQRLKVTTIVGTRPEIIKLSRVIAELEKYTEHVLIHTGQNYDYELNEVFFSELEIKTPDYFLDVASENSAQMIGKVIIKSDEILGKIQPDALLIYGDTNSCLSAISAKRRKIPIFHMEAGNRCFDQRVPEEINRKIVDHVSDINLTLSEHARRYLIAEGIRAESVIKVGSSMQEVFAYYQSGIENSVILNKLGLQKKEYFIVSAHREENVDLPDNLVELLKTLNLIAHKYDKQIIASTHPRTRKRLEMLPKLKLDSRIQFLKPFGFLDYSKLQKEAFCVLSDSGSLTEDSSLLGFPAITIRQTHERPEGMDVATLIIGGLAGERICQAIEVVTEQAKSKLKSGMVPDYEVDNVSFKIVRIIMSYVDYVNRTTWFKTSEKGYASDVSCVS